MNKLRWMYIPDYRQSDYLQPENLLVLFSGKRYIALDIERLTLDKIEKNAKIMVKELKNDLRKQRRIKAEERISRRKKR